MPKTKVSRVAKVSRVPQVEELVEPIKEVTSPAKSSRTKLAIGLALLVILGIFLFMKGFLVAATVNNEPIYRLTLIQTLERQGGEKTLDSLVNQVLINQAAKKERINVSSAEVDKNINTLSEDLKKQGQDLNTALASQRMTLADLKEQIKLQKTVEKLLADKIKITETEIKDFIEQNKSYFPEKTSASDMEKTARQQLTQQKITTEYNTWIETLRKDAKINYFLQF